MLRQFRLPLQSQPTTPAASSDVQPDPRLANHPAHPHQPPPGCGFAGCVDRKTAPSGNFGDRYSVIHTVEAAAVDARDEPHCWRDERLEPASGLHLAFAVDTANGVVAPVIHNVDSLSLEQISQRRRELTGMARRQRTRMADLSGAVFTLSNLGMTGADFFAPIVNWPQTAILATGRMTAEPVVRDGSIEIGWRMWANMALDHRAVDGAAGARFLAALQDRLEPTTEGFLDTYDDSKRLAYCGRTCHSPREKAGTCIPGGDLRDHFPIHVGYRGRFSRTGLLAACSAAMRRITKRTSRR